MVQLLHLENTNTMKLCKLFSLALVSALLALQALAAQPGEHPARPQFNLLRIPGHPAAKDVTLTLTIEGCDSMGPYLPGRALLLYSSEIRFLEDGTAFDSDTVVKTLVPNRDIFCHGVPGKTWYTIQLSAAGKSWPARKFRAKSGKKIDLVKVALGK